MTKPPWSYPTKRIEAIKRYCLKHEKWRWDTYERSLVRYKVIVDESSNANAEIEDLAECELNIQGSQATQMQL